MCDSVLGPVVPNMFVSDIDSEILSPALTALCCDEAPSLCPCCLPALDATPISVITYGMLLSPIRARLLPEAFPPSFSRRAPPPLQHLSALTVSVTLCSPVLWK